MSVGARQVAVAIATRSAVVAGGPATSRAIRAVNDGIAIELKAQPLSILVLATFLPTRPLSLLVLATNSFRLRGPNDRRMVTQPVHSQEAL
jgi:hypothetical protein